LFYLKKTTIYIPPEYLLVGLDTLNEDVWQLEYETGLNVDSDETLRAITQCIEKEDQAKMELEYHCLNLTDEHCQNGVTREIELYFNFLIQYGNNLLNRIQTIGLYHNGIFPYVYSKKRINAIQFIRKDIFQQINKRDLIQDGYQL